MAKQAVRRASSNWRRHFFYRKETLRTTWKFRLSALFLIGFVAMITRGFWAEWFAQSLICEERVTPSDALLVENYDPDYLLFEHANTLNRKGVASRVFVLVDPGNGPEGTSLLSRGIAEMTGRAAHLQTMEFIRISNSEPITLNTAYQIRDTLTARHVKSIVVVTRNFRSRRAMLIYNTVLNPAGIQVGCAPVTGQTSTANWTQSTHGLQEVLMQFGKLQYYRFYALPSGKPEANSQTTTSSPNH